MVEESSTIQRKAETRDRLGVVRLYFMTSHIMSSIVPSQSTKPPPELDARDVLDEVDPDEDEDEKADADEVAIATDEEPEEPLAVARLKALAEPAIASLALDATLSKRPSSAKFFMTLSMGIPPLFSQACEPMGTLIQAKRMASHTEQRVNKRFYAQNRLVLRGRHNCRRVPSSLARRASATVFVRFVGQVVVAVVVETLDADRQDPHRARRNRPRSGFAPPARARC
jgi:sirohydrochlorin ferrochelatase